MGKLVVARFLPLSPVTALTIVELALRRSPVGDLDKRFRLVVDHDGNANLSILTKHSAPNRPVDPALEGIFYAAHNELEQNMKAGRMVPADLAEQGLRDDFGDPDPILECAKVIVQCILDENGARLSASRGHGPTHWAEARHDSHYAVRLGGDLAGVAKDFAAIEWRSTGMRIACEQGVGAIAETGTDMTIGATQDLAGAHGRFYEKDVRIFASYPCAYGAILLHPKLRLSIELRDLISRLMARVESRVEREIGKLLAFDWEEGRVGVEKVTVLMASLPRRAVLSTATASGRDGGAHLVDIRRIDLVAEPDATERLARLMEDAADGLGHRLELHALPQFAEYGDELNEVLRQIEELKMRRDYLLGEAPGREWRLLRFPGRAIGAMVDYLRRFPPAVIDESLIRYAWQSTGGDVAGVHYLLYQQDREAWVEPPFPEAYWRSKAESGTIVHGLDPFFAQFAASLQAHSLVFTPRHKVVVPNFRTSVGDVDKYLRTGFGGLLGLRDVFADPDADRAGDIVPEQEIAKIGRPIYLLSETDAGDIRLEIMDGDAFQPIGRVVPFINDNLELSHRIDMAEFIELGASKAWRREQLTALDAAGADIVNAVSTRMQAVATDFGNQAADIYGTLADEIDAIRMRLDSVVSFVNELAIRASQVEKIAEEAIDAAGHVDQDAQSLPSDLIELNAIRRRVEAATTMQATASRIFADKATRHLDQLRDDIARIKDALDHER